MNLTREELSYLRTLVLVDKESWKVIYKKSNNNRHIFYKRYKLACKIFEKLSKL